MPRTSAWMVPDVLMVSLAGAAALIAWALYLLVVPGFAAMYAEFQGELPAASAAVMAPSAALFVPGTYTLSLLLAAAARQWLSTGLGRIGLLLAVVIGMALPIATVTLLYSPLWAVAGAID